MLNMYKYPFAYALYHALVAKRWHCGLNMPCCAAKDYTEFAPIKLSGQMIEIKPESTLHYNPRS